MSNHAQRFVGIPQIGQGFDDIIDKKKIDNLEFQKPNNLINSTLDIRDASFDSNLSKNY